MKNVFLTYETEEGRSGIVCKDLIRNIQETSSYTQIYLKDGTIINSTSPLLELYNQLDGMDGRQLLKG